MTRFPFYAPDRASEYERYAAEYVFEQNEPTPWTPLRRPMREARALLLTSSGLRLASQHEFARLPGGGSAEFREISVYVSPDQLAYDFTNFDPREVEQDLNVLTPVDRLKELVDEGVLGGLHETFFSFFGLCSDSAALRENAGRLAEKLRSADVDLAFLFPANLVCNETIGVIARTLERGGLSTVALSTVKEVTRQIKVPRALFLNFPFGRTLGRAHNRALQRSILEDMIHALKTFERPARLLELPYRWEGMI